MNAHLYEWESNCAFVFTMTSRALTSLLLCAHRQDCQRSSMSPALPIVGAAQAAFMTFTGMQSKWQSRLHCKKFVCDTSTKTGIVSLNTGIELHCTITVIYSKIICYFLSLIVSILCGIFLLTFHSLQVFFQFAHLLCTKQFKAGPFYSLLHSLVTF